MNQVSRLSALIILLSMPFVLCFSQATPNFQATFYAEDRGGVNLALIVDPGNTNLLFEPSKERIGLTAPSESINPWTFFNNGDFYVAPDDKSSLVYGSCCYAKVMSNGTERTISAFKRKGAGEKWIGSAAGDGNIFSIGNDGKRNLIGQSAFMKIKTPGTEKDAEVEQTVTATKMVGPKNSPWITCLGDKICRIEKDGNITQIGWLDWRKISIPDGSMLIIIMTKGMDKNAKWAGQYDGKFFLDKS